MILEEIGDIDGGGFDRVGVEQGEVLGETAADAALREVPDGVGGRGARAGLGFGQHFQVARQWQRVITSQPGCHIVIRCCRVFVITVARRVIIAGLHVMKIVGVTGR